MPDEFDSKRVNVNGMCSAPQRCTVVTLLRNPVFNCQLSDNSVIGPILVQVLRIIDQRTMCVVCILDRADAGQVGGYLISLMSVVVPWPYNLRGRNCFSIGRVGCKCHIQFPVMLHS